MKKFTVMLAVLAFACGEAGHGGDDEIIFGLKVSVKDAITGEYLNDGVIVTATNSDGETEELYSFTSVSSVFYGAAETQGTYTISITKDGYEAYTSQPVVVEGGHPHVSTQEMTIGLEPAV